eukprot:scaffold258537_cov18-Prasinocladus_malaysianus.AAC.1
MTTTEQIVAGQRQRLVLYARDSRLFALTIHTKSLCNVFLSTIDSPGGLCRPRCQKLLLLACVAHKLYPHLRLAGTPTCPSLSYSTAIAYEFVVYNSFWERAYGSAN